MEAKETQVLDQFDHENVPLDQHLIGPHEYRIIPSSNLKSYLFSNFIYIKLFYLVHDKRLFSSHASWRKKSDNNLEQYCKNYVQDLTKRLALQTMMLTTTELSTKWDLVEYNVVGYKDVVLKVITIKSWVKNKNNKKWVIIVHGLNSHKFRAIFFGLIYLRQGYNILVYDQRNHGESSISQTTMGYCEKFDLEVVVKFLNHQINEKVTRINFHGWSMGTFVISEYLKLNIQKNRKTKWVVFDSTIANLNDLYYYYMEKIKVDFYEHYYAIRYIAIEKRDYDPEQINPGQDLKTVSKKPFLYILNKQDRATPYVMGLEAFKNKRSNEKKALSKMVSFNCDHVKGISYAPEVYLKTIIDFLNSCRWK